MKKIFFKGLLLSQKINNRYLEDRYINDSLFKLLDVSSGKELDKKFKSIKKEFVNLLKSNKYYEAYNMLVTNLCSILDVNCKFYDVDYVFNDEHLVDIVSLVSSKNLELPVKRDLIKYHLNYKKFGIFDTSKFLFLPIFNFKNEPTSYIVLEKYGDISKSKYNFYIKTIGLLWGYLGDIINSNVNTLISKKLHYGIIDSLTKVFQKGFFTKRMRETINSVSLKNEDLAVYFLDIDYFKNINDIYGHSIGDKVLYNFAKMLRKSVRNVDIIGRVGGEEFVILCVFNKQRDVDYLTNNLVNRFRKNIINNSILKKYNITFSGGVSILSEVSNITNEKLQNISNILLNLADERLYTSKASGRNQITTSSATFSILDKFTLQKCSII